jgi:hypothetical protein
MNGLFPVVPAPRVPSDGLAWVPGFPVPPPRIPSWYQTPGRHTGAARPVMTLARLRDQWETPDRGYEIGPVDGQLYAFRLLDREPASIGPAATPAELERLLIRDWAGRSR